jgi:hypothetical protein
LANDKALGQVEWFEETASGRLSWRERQLGELLAELSAGDNIVVSELEPLAEETRVAARASLNPASP